MEPLDAVDSPSLSCTTGETDITWRIDSTSPTVTPLAEQGGYSVEYGPRAVEDVRDGADRGGSAAATHNAVWERL